MINAALPQLLVLNYNVPTQMQLIEMRTVQLQQLSLEKNTYFQSSEYIASQAASKQAELWDSITADQTSGHYPSALGQLGLFTESMKPTFYTIGDVFNQPAHWWDGPERVKEIHSVGAVGRVSLVSNGNHPFTGIFKGASNGLVRLSSANKPSLTDTSSPLTPGMGLKFLRDGVHSANLVSMWSVNGQPGEWNYFAHQFSNHIKAASGLALAAVSKKFSTVTDWIQLVGLSDFARYDEAGNSTETPVFPFELIFEPASDVATRFSNATPSDPFDFLTQLKDVPANSNLYNVSGWTAPSQLGGKLVPIGSLVLDGSMVTSKFGDQQLYIRHENFADDVKLQPSWNNYAARYSLGGKCPYQSTLMELGLY